MKETYDFGGIKKGLRMITCTLIHTLFHIHIYEFTYEFMTRKVLQICSASQSNILCHLRNLQLPLHVNRYLSLPRASISLSQFVKVELSMPFIAHVKI